MGDDSKRMNGSEGVTSEVLEGVNGFEFVTCKGERVNVFERGGHLQNLRWQTINLLRIVSKII